MRINGVNFDLTSATRDPKYMMEFLAGFSDLTLPDVWSYELLVVDNKIITLGQLIQGVVLLVLGYFMCRTISREIEKRLLSRLDIDASLRHTLKTIIFYFLLVILTLFILHLLQVPVTVFTVIGGALAIGVGLGAQNIVNNFISGLILMIERPIRVGDIIDIEGLKGSVEHIGARSTRIKSMDNTHYVVPNSSLLEKNVLNWTLSDDIVRTKVVVGVAYGSPTRKVEELLREAVKDQEKILRYPEPVVLFSDFGDNSLNFEVFFWSNVHNIMQLRLLESTVRFKIDDLFREAKIVIAFPQRDVHLDSLSPIQVEMVTARPN